MGCYSHISNLGATSYLAGALVISAGILLASRLCGDATSVMRALVRHVWIPNTRWKHRDAIIVLEDSGMHHGVSAQGVVMDQFRKRCLAHDNSNERVLAMATWQLTERPKERAATNREA